MRRMPAALILALPVAIGAFTIYAWLVGPDLPTHGVSPHRWALGTIIIGVLTVPLWASIAALWAVGETLVVHGRARRRLEQGRCLVCGYPGPDPGRVCPECGAAAAPLPGKQGVQRRAMRRAVIAIAAGFLLGCAGAEAWVLRDAMAFVAEARAFEKAGGTGQYWRTCRWPRRSYSMHFSAGRGYWVND